MNNIENSVLAIKQSCPKSGIYLRVVGKGNDQCLQAVKINWFGRLLMWLGCSNASMAKVAKFLHQNIGALTNSKLLDVQDEQNPLGKLLARAKKFDQNHPAKISHLIGKITSTYTSARSQSQQTQVTSSNTPSTPPPAVATVLQKQIPVPASTKANVTVQESVDTFKTARGHVGKVADYILKKRPQDWNIDLSKAEEEMKNIKELLKDCLQDPQRFAAVIKEMTPEEVGIYVAFGLIAPQNANANKINQDIFEILPLQRFSQSSTISLAISCMSLDQLKSLLTSIAEHGNISYSNSAVFYKIVDLIHQVRSPDEQKILFEVLVSQPCYQNEIFPFTLLVWNSSNLDKQQTMDTLLAEYYIRYLILQKHDLSSFLRTVHFAPSGHAINLSSPLQNKAFLAQLSIQEQDALTLAIVNLARGGPHVADSLLLNDIMLADPSRAHVLFTAIIDSIDHAELCSGMRKKIPGCDRGYVKALLDANDQANLLKFVNRSKLSITQSILTDETFIDTLTEQQLLMLGEGIVKSYPTKEWDRFYIIRKKIMGDSTLAVAFYKRCGIVKIPVYCENHLHDRKILKAIVDSMNSGEKLMWNTTQCAKSLEIMGIRL